MEAKGYSLWLVPRGKTEDELNTIIRELSARFGGPVFRPHLTLLGDIEEPKEQVIAKAKDLVSPGFGLRLSSASSGNTYFRCVYAVPEKCPALTKLNKKARELFGRANDIFMPHVSLLYGDNKQKEDIAGSLKLGIDFPVDRICVVHTDGPPSAWKIIREIPLL